MPWFSLSCERETFSSDIASDALSFSVDTLSFDTVFTTIGTTTQRLTVYNRTSDNLLIDWVTLDSGYASCFRLNVDGDTSMRARDLELAAGDSIFIFVQANINPNDLTAPFLREDAIRFSNGQRLPLTAWGRNAVYHKGSADSIHVIDCDNWDHTRPHIMLGMCGIDSACTLVLQPGEELHFGNDALLLVYTGGRLVAQGTDDAPVLFTSLRHDGWYSFLPGQWQTIWFYNGSVGNIIDHAVVENATGGLRGYPESQLTVTNTVIRNMSDCGIIGQGATITGRNLLVYDCLSDITVLIGGSYDFRRCTFANYWSYSSRKVESVVLSNAMLTADGIVGGDLLKADFTDCIIWGTYSNEVLLSAIEGYAMNYHFTHSIVRGGDWSEDPLFTDPSEDDYTLQEDSPAAGIGYSPN